MKTFLGFFLYLNAILLGGAGYAAVGYYMSVGKLHALQALPIALIIINLCALMGWCGLRLNSNLPMPWRDTE